MEPSYRETLNRVTKVLAAPNPWEGSEPEECIVLKDDLITLCALAAVLEGFTPTPDKINVLPKCLRDFIHDLETNADPAGTIQALADARITVEAIQPYIIALKEQRDELKSSLEACLELLQDSEGDDSQAVEEPVKLTVKFHSDKIWHKFQPDGVPHTESFYTTFHDNSYYFGDEFEERQGGFITRDAAVTAAKECLNYAAKQRMNKS